MIQEKQVLLRSLELSDIPDILPYWNEKEFMDYSGRINPLSNDELEEWLIKTWKGRNQGKNFTFAIEHD
jgi:RimJ/RimL family protein N-acetyltransferase